MVITKKEFLLNFKGFHVVDCCVRSKRIFYFSLREDYTQREDWKDGDRIPEECELDRRVVSFVRYGEGKGWGNVELSGIDNVVAGISHVPKEQFVGVTAAGNVYVIGQGANDFEEDIPSWQMRGINRGTTNSSRTIEGVIYVAGGGRSVGYREGKNQWVSLTQMMPFEYKRDWKSAGFRDIDGFARDDIYCVGGKGDVWHFNGVQWRQLPFPGNLNLYTVCCAEDGLVYISGYEGTTYRGKGDSWSQIYKGEMALPFMDMGWYEDKVWCTSDYGLWTIEQDDILTAAVGDEVNVASGNLDIADGVLLVAGYNGAAYKEHGKWNVIF